MATKLQFYQAVAEQAITDVAAHSGNWRNFLDTAARMYKYPFHDQLMIYKQRPNATACAELELWNETFNRWVRRGSKGIALIDESGSYPRLKYVFDVSDTEPSLYRAKPVHLWEMRQEHKAPVLAELARNYEDIDPDGTPAGHGALAEAFRNIAKQLAEEYYNDNRREIAFSAENSVLEPVYYNDFSGTLIEQADDNALQKAFTEVLSESIAYTIMTRCGLDTSEYDDAFESVIDFNTRDMVQAVGVATADLSEQVLRDVELTIRKYERVKTAQIERSEQNYDRNPYLQPSRGLSSPQHSTERAAERGNSTTRQVRENEESVPQRPQEDNVQPNVAVGDAVSAPAGSGRGGESVVRADNERADGADESAGQGARADEVDGGDEHPESPSGGSSGERTDLRVDPPPQAAVPEPEPPPQTVAATPPPTLYQFDTKPITETLSTSAITLAEVDSILRDGGNDRESYLRIAARFAKAKTPEEMTAYLRREYLQGVHGRRERESGKGFDFGNSQGTVSRSVCAWFDKDGISLAVGITAKNNIHKVTISWEQAAARVNELMLAGEYVDRATFDIALDNELSELAGRLWFFYRDDMGHIPEEWDAEKGGYPEDEAIIKGMLDDPDSRQSILDRLEADVNQFNYDVHERVWHNPDRLLADMREAMLPATVFPNDEYSYKRDFSAFITQDEIDAYLLNRSAETKYQILSEYLRGNGDKDFEKFLKNSYGLGGGGSHALGGADNSYGDYSPGKGITLSRGQIGEPFTKVTLNWNQAAKRVKTLIESGHFMSRAELDGIASYEKLVLVRNINWFFYDLPQEYPHPFPGKPGYNGNEYLNEDGSKALDFTYPHEAEWQAINNLLDNPENVDALLAQMQPIFENTIEEDRYYQTRKTAWNALNEWCDGSYTLFPGIENLPDPDTPMATRFDGNRRVAVEPSAIPAKETVIDLGDDEPSDWRNRVFTPTVQMSLFDFPNDSSLPVLPTVDEQRAKIDDKLRQEAKEVSEQADAPFLNISDTDKARLYEAFADNPRSRAAVNLVKEIYGDSLGMPVPQAVKKITELVEMGLLDGIGDPYKLFDRVRDELSERGYAVSGEIVEDGINLFRANVGHGDFSDVADYIESEMLTEDEPEISEIHPTLIGDFYEVYGDEARIVADALNLTLTTRSNGPVVGFPKSRIDDYTNRLADIGIEVVFSESAEQSVDNRHPYAVGDRVWLGGREFKIDSISDRYKEPMDDLDRRFLNYGRDISMLDVQMMQNRYPISRTMYQAAFELELTRDERNAEFLPLGEVVAQPAIEVEAQLESERQAEPMAQAESAPETQAEPELPEEPAATPEPEPLDFDEVAPLIADRVWADEEFAAALTEATVRGQLRKPLDAALERVIEAHKDDEPQIYAAYNTDNDFNDDIYRYVYTQSWEVKQMRQAQFAEATDHAEVAEIDVIFPPESGTAPPPALAAESQPAPENTPQLAPIPETHSAPEVQTAPVPTPEPKPTPRAIVDVILSPGLQVQQAYDDFEAIKGGRMTADRLTLENYNGKYRATGLDALILNDIFSGKDYANAAHGLLYTTGREQMPRFEVNDMLMTRELAQQAGYAIELDGEVLPLPRQPRVNNFRITDDHLGEGGAKTKYRNNILALQTLKTIERENRSATRDEQEIMSRYIGWGGLPQAFDPENRDWAKEYAELSDLLTQEEFESARASTLNAHYTSPVVVKAMWEAIRRMGFDRGNILEPSMGVGNFFGLLPQSMAGSKLYGVELDSVTARIAQKLYPSANIQQAGFEKTEFSDAFFDLAIGNVPFGNYQVADKRYDKHGFSIHNYFFAKTLDKVRPGGVVAFITSKFTMDERNPKVRKYLAARAELLGAVRLPNNAFLKNAGTETTMDILFLQKRDRPLDIEPDWVHLGLTDDGILCNRYFLDNPEMVCGVMGLDVDMNDRYGADNYTACLPLEGADLGEQVRAALALVDGKIEAVELDDLDGVDNHAIPADSAVKNFSYAVVDNTVYFRENSLMYPVDLPATTLDRIKGMIGLRDCVQELIALQLDDYTTDDEITAKQAELNTLYDSFLAEYGLINSTANNRAFNADSAYYLLSSLEILNEDGELERKADMFTKRTIKQKTVVTHVDTASEALSVSLGEKGRVDLEYMSALTGKDEATLTTELRGVIFADYRMDVYSNNIKHVEVHDVTYRTADEFLSGNVREKLKKYQNALAALTPDSPYMQTVKDNIAALTAIQPKDLEAGEISVRLGATWIEPRFVQQFMHELLNTTPYNQRVYQVLYHPFTGEWQVTGKGKSQFSDIAATVTYGTGRMNAYQIMEDTLNLRDVRVYDHKEDADGKERRVLNKKETMLAQQKQELIKQAFKDWIWNDPERRQELVTLYNERFNSVRPREYDGSHITFGGISQEINLRPHQLNAIAHILYGGNTLLAHEVGAGKTFEMVAAAMESKRLGQCHKSLFAVPNHLTEQWAAEFLRLYPSANILVATKKDFEMRNRKKFCAKIATGDYDAVIIGHSQLEKIPMSRERQERQMREQIWEVEEGIRELKESNGERFSIKQLEKTKRSLEARLTKLLESKKRDDVVTFEELGVDRLYIDEAHGFKNLFLYTKMRNVAGLSTSEAQKSSDLFMKCRYLDELTGNRGVIFATGTPISNSMTEMYTMQRYLQHDRLIGMGLNHFDSWASIFGETTTSIELAPEGTGYRARTRFAKFHNLPELMTVFKEVADIQTADMLKLPVPEAKYETIVVEPSELQKDMVEELSERAAAVHNRKVDPQTDNMLKITTDGRKIGLDQRLINDALEDFPGSKVNACTEKVFEIWRDTTKDRLTQLVFCDFSTPKKDGKFNVYDDIKSKLIARGVPEHEIAFIHDADTETKKKELFAKVRQGKVRVLFGSTFKMGSGTNVQDRLIAIHDADCPWRPADLAQRAGRIVRQGNKNTEVQIYRYATSGTFDSYLWQTVEAKQKFIAQIMSSKSPVRSCEDVDETALSYAEIKALCAGNPLIAEKMQLDNDVARLRMLKSEYKSQHYRLEDSLLKTFPQQIASVTERIAGIDKDIALYAAEKEKCTTVTTTSGAATVESKFPGMVINGVTHTEKEPAAKALLEACKGIKGRDAELAVGEYMGFKLSLCYEGFGQTINLLMRGTMTYKVELGTDTFGNITRINNALDKLPERLDGAKSQLANYEKQAAAAKEELAKPFAQEEELQAKEQRLALLNADLNIDGDGGLEVEGDTEFSEEKTDVADSEAPRDEPDEEADIDEPEPPSKPQVSQAYTIVGKPPTFTYGEPRTGTYGKALPTMLDDIRSISAGIKPPVAGGTKSAELDI
jgi:N12 class adenine-specific DNA methylase